jgi:hypothetical protein
MRVERPDVKISPSDRYDTVHVKRSPFKYTVDGKTIKLKQHELVEFPDTVKDKNLEIDIDYYIEKKIIGQLARFIGYSVSSDIDVTKNYLTQLCRPYASVYSNMHRVHKRMFKQYNKRCKFVAEVVGKSDAEKMVDVKIVEIKSELMESSRRDGKVMFKQAKKEGDMDIFHRKKIDQYHHHPSNIDKMIAEAEVNIKQCRSNIITIITNNNMKIGGDITEIHKKCEGINDEDRIVEIYREYMDSIGNDVASPEELDDAYCELKIAISERETYTYMLALYNDMNSVIPNYNMPNMIERHSMSGNLDNVHL